MTKQEPKPSAVNNDLIIYRLDEIKGEIIEMKKQYVTKEESLALRQEIHALREEVAAIKKNRNLIGWLYPTLSAAFASLFTYLVIQFFVDKK